MLRPLLSFGPWCLLGSAVLSAFPVMANGQCPHDWLPGDGVQGVAWAVLATTVWDPDGPGPQPELLVAGGAIEYAGDVFAGHIAAWDGANWQALGAGMDWYVHALTVYDGQLIAGGRFTSAGGVSANGIARWDGSAWHPLGSGMQPDYS
ncbi:MAG: hypothetical protein ACYTGE_00230, partial [Planctomycetota bacterium]